MDTGQESMVYAVKEIEKSWSLGYTAVEKLANEIIGIIMTSVLSQEKEALMYNIIGRQTLMYGVTGSRKNCL